MSIWVTGDCHGDLKRFSKTVFPEQKEMTRDDFVVILGDFGMIWNKDQESKHEKHWLDWLEDHSYTTLFIDGNHENFDRLNSYQVEEWNGGLVHKIRPHVIHLMRGQVFTICDKKFFTFGGASSHDISDGILDYEDDDWKEKAKILDKSGKYMYRVKGLSWWKQEMPTEEEMQIGIDNLKKHNNTVDFILTHCTSSSVVSGDSYKPDYLTNYLEELRMRVEYRKHLCGHYHIDIAVNDKDIVLYEQIVRIV